jgi:iron complex outermembrane receptor protein
LRLRGGYDRAVRTPSFAEAVIPVSGNVANLAIIDPCSLSSPSTRARPEIRALCLSQMSQAAFSSYVQTSPAISAPLLGNPALRPENSESFRLGVKLTPNFTSAAFDELAFSIDYYSIRVNNAIGLYPLAQKTLAGCFNQDPAQSNPDYSPTHPFCRLVERNGTGVISTISQPYVNMGAIKTEGIDIGIKWEAALDGTADFVGVDSSITRVLAYKIQNAPNAPFQDFSGTLGDGLLYAPSASGSVAPQPHWRSLTKLHYRSAQIKLEFTWRFISGMKDPNAIANYSPRSTPDYSLFDLALNFTIRDGLTLSAGSENLFDRKPPTITYPGMTMASVYDVVGRSLYISARAEL